MNFSLTLPIHSIPLWFLVLSLFLPRICLLIAWAQHNMPQYVPASVGLIQIIVALLIPRVLIMFWIYEDQGITLWFLLHTIAFVVAWGGGGHRISRSRRSDRID